jgi:hypothetical protein
MRLTTVLVCLAVTGLCGEGETMAPSVFARGNLVAWCIVPFDANKRGPAERAEMLVRLGITRLAYDWRQEHVPTFEAEIEAMRGHGIAFFAFWGSHPKAFELFAKHKMTPQIWQTLRGGGEGSQEQKVERSAKAMLPLVERTRQMGCKLGLYNHGGWGGEPDNMVAVCRWLRERGEADHVGIVYNLHHGHGHIDDFPQALARMKPYLLCLNLNGMNTGAKPKILPLGKGEHDRALLAAVQASGYRGPIGILDHRGSVDAEQSLRENLDGLKQLLEQLGDEAALGTYR